MPSSLNRIFTYRYVGLLGVLAVLVALSYLNLAQLIDAEEGSAARINVTGRQRMLSQRIWGLTEALARAGEGPEGNDIRDRLSSAIVLMERSHMELLEGAPDTGSGDVMQTDSKSILSALDHDINAYLDLAKELQALPVESIGGRLGRLREMGDALLFDLDTAVRVLQDRSEQSVIALRRRAALVTLFMWTLLAISVLGVFRPLIRRLLDAHGQLRVLSSELALVEQQERRRVADELHEDVLQTVVAAKMQLAVVPGEDRESREQRVIKAEQLLASVATSIRNQAFELGPPVLYSLGLVPAVRSLASHFARESGIEIKVEQVNDLGSPLPEHLRIVLFRSIRELLTNVVRHSQASSACVTIRNSNPSVEVEIRDDGIGFDPGQLGTFSPETTKFGLLAIRERMTYLGGEMDIDSRPGAGMAVRLRLDRPAA